MHQDDSRIGAGNHRGHCRVLPQGAYVIDDRCSAIQSDLCNSRLGGIDRNRNRYTMCQSLHHRNHVSQFILLTNGMCARPSRLSPEIDDVRPLFNKFQRMCNGSFRFNISPTIIEGISRDVYDAHDKRTPFAMNFSPFGREPLLRRYCLW